MSVRTWWDQKESERLKQEREERLGRAVEAKKSGEDEGDDADADAENEGVQ